MRSQPKSTQAPIQIPHFCRKCKKAKSVKFDLPYDIQKTQLFPNYVRRRIVNELAELKFGQENKKYQMVVAHARFKRIVI